MRDPDDFAATLRERGVDITERRVLMSILAGSEQEPDLSEPVVCDGLGRIRHFRRMTSQGWPDNPLPLEPAARWLGHASGLSTRALVYQNAVCNWRCWYCFVPFNLLGRPCQPLALGHRQAAHRALPGTALMTAAPRLSTFPAASLILFLSGPCGCSTL